MRYNRLDDYEPVFLAPDESLQLACCDCGLVHLYEYVVIDKNGDQVDNLGIGLRFIRQRRATAQLRRHKYGHLHHGKKWVLRRQYNV